MKSVLGLIVLLACSLAAVPILGQAPAGATGQCKDNSYTSAAKKWQACAGHKGVQTWFADAKAGAAPGALTGAAPAAPAAQATKAAPAPAPAAVNPSSTVAPSPAKTSAAVATAPGGGPGLVWVNTATNVYHCPGGTFYGKTKDGKYMSEADAKKAGARPDRNKACSK